MRYHTGVRRPCGYYVLKNFFAWNARAGSAALALVGLLLLLEDIFVVVLEVWDIDSSEV